MPNPHPAEDDDPPDHPLQRVSAQRFESLIDQQIRAAEAAGQFNNLAGAGKPLDLSDDAHVPEELRAGFRMLKNAGAAPPWIELQQSIRSEQARIARWLERTQTRWARIGPHEQAQLREEYRGTLRDLNKQITSYNLTAPPAAGQLPLLIVDQEMAKLPTT